MLNYFPGSSSQWDKKPFTHLSAGVFMGSEVIWPRPHTWFSDWISLFISSKYLWTVSPWSMVWLYPIIFCTFPIMQCLCYVEAILELDLKIREATSIKPGWANSHGAASQGRVSRFLGHCKKCILAHLAVDIGVERALDLESDQFDSGLACSIF